MSYKTRSRERQIRRHLKQSRAADKRIDKFLKGYHEPRAVGLMDNETQGGTGDNRVRPA
jgi:hypothetical protein